jgi:hypothetical protein
MARRLAGAVVAIAMCVCMQSIHAYPEYYAIPATAWTGEMIELCMLNAGPSHDMHSGLHPIIFCDVHSLIACGVTHLSLQAECKRAAPMHAFLC